MKIIQKCNEISTTARNSKKGEDSSDNEELTSDSENLEQNITKNCRIAQKCEASQRTTKFVKVRNYKISYKI